MVTTSVARVAAAKAKPKPKSKAKAAAPYKKREVPEFENLEEALEAAHLCTKCVATKKASEPYNSPPPLEK